MSAYAVELVNITKRFGLLTANDNITLRVERGSVHALLGENGAGKSTLMSILFGLYPADEGQIFLFGKEIKANSPIAASAAGVGMVHQHFKLVPSYSVMQNIILGVEPRDGLGHIKYKEAKAEVKALSVQYGLEIDPDAKVEDISIGMQQRVEILKTLYRKAELIVLDEPTAVLTPQEITELLGIVKKLQAEGKTIILITHKLKEIKEAAQKVSVLRRGRLIETIDTDSADEGRLAELMVGRPVKLQIEKKPAKIGREVLRIENLSVKSARGSMAVNGLSLTVHAGEIVGIAGVDGNGQSELALAVCGLAAAFSGNIYLNAKNVQRLNVRKRREAGMAITPEDRQKQGLVLDFSIAENFILNDSGKPPYSGRLGLLNFEAINSAALKAIEEFDIRSADSWKSRAGSLSGGNQQKLIIAREIAGNPQLLIVCQPTRGLDVGSIEYIHKRLVEERDKGKAVLLISFELDEIMNLCDRIAAISHGKIIGVADAGKADAWQIGAMMAGVSQKEGEGHGGAAKR